MKKSLQFMSLLLIVLLLAACGGSGNSVDVDAANEEYNPGQARIDDGDIQAIMEQTKDTFTKDEVRFFTYHVKNGHLEMDAKIDEDLISKEEVVKRFVDAYTNSQASSLEFYVRGVGTYNMPLGEEIEDLDSYFVAD